MVCKEETRTNGWEDVYELTKTCKFCEKVGHYANLCPERYCDSCGKKGHNMYKCPQTKEEDTCITIGYPAVRSTVEEISCVKEGSVNETPSPAGSYTVTESY